MPRGWVKLLIGQSPGNRTREAEPQREQGLRLGFDFAQPAAQPTCSTNNQQRSTNNAPNNQ